LLKAAEREVGDLTARRDALNVALVDAGTDHEALARLGTELAEVQGLLDEAELRWLELAEEAEG
jgi:hypothetical protein